MNQRIKIDGREIGDRFPPYIVAEISANHNGSRANAFEIIKKAKISGADAVKIQTYKPDTITLDSDLPDFQITEGLWKGCTLHELYERAHTPWDWHRSLFDKAREVGITLFSSPFDTTAVDFLEDLQCPAYKIASFEAIDIPLIKYAAETKKPIIISTGMADKNEIGEAVEAARSAGCIQLALLHCVSAYPASHTDYNLLTLSDMKRRFGLITGLSDHTLTNTTAVASAALGARIIEKHVTLDRKHDGPDNSFSLEPADLAKLVAECRTVWEALGKVSYDLKPGEKDTVKYRRSLYFVKDLSEGSCVSEEDVRSVRPGYGLPPKELKNILGKRVNKSVAAATPVSWCMFDDIDN